MATNKKQAKFFCENCNTEVPADAKFCSKCGKFFYSVRCPMCGKTGNQNIFLNGCPECGYAVTSSYNLNPKLQSKSAKLKKNTDNQLFKKKRIEGEDSLPSWIYGLCAIVFTGIIFILLRYFAA